MDVAAIGEDVADVGGVKSGFAFADLALEQTLIHGGNDGMVAVAGDGGAEADVVIVEKDPRFPRGQFAASQVHRAETESAVGHAANEARRAFDVNVFAAQLGLLD